MALEDSVREPAIKSKNCYRSSGVVCGVLLSTPVLFGGHKGPHIAPIAESMGMVCRGSRMFVPSATGAASLILSRPLLEGWPSLIGLFHTVENFSVFMLRCNDFKI